MNLADALNLGCMCQTLSPDRLREQLETDPSLAGMTQQLAASHPHLFSDTAVFLDAGTRDALAATVSAIERVIALPAYQTTHWRTPRPSPGTPSGPRACSWATTSTWALTVHA
jgi:hypothetical protein